MSRLSCAAMKMHFINNLRDLILNQMHCNTKKVIIVNSKIALTGFSGEKGPINGVLC